MLTLAGQANNVFVIFLVDLEESEEYDVLDPNPNVDEAGQLAHHWAEVPLSCSRNAKTDNLIFAKLFDSEINSEFKFRERINRNAKES